MVLLTLKQFASYLDLHFEIDNGGRLKTILIVNFPFISRNILESSACGVCISHLVHYFKACVQYSDFLDTARLLIQKLLKQGYVAPRLNHRYTNFAVGFTISLTIAKYTYFKWQLIFHFLRIFFLFPLPLQKLLPDLTVYVNNTVSVL